MGTSKPKVTPRRAATRQRLVGAAAEVLTDQGFAGASVELICERAGFTRGAFYSNFSSLSELALEIVNHRTEALLAAIESVAGRPDLEVDEVVHAALDEVARSTLDERRWHLLGVELELHGFRDVAFGRALAARQDEVQQRFADLVSGLADERGLALTVPARDLVRTIIAIHSASLAAHYGAPRRVRPDALDRSVLPLITRAAVRPA